MGAIIAVFGNARYARNLFESAIERQAVRLSTVPVVTPAMLQELTLHDLGFKYEDDEDRPEAGVQPREYRQLT